MFRKMEGACEMEGVHAGAGIDHTQFDQSRFCQGRQFQAVTLLDEFIYRHSYLFLHISNQLLSFLDLDFGHF